MTQILMDAIHNCRVQRGSIAPPDPTKPLRRPSSACDLGGPRTECRADAGPPPRRLSTTLVTRASSTGELKVNGGSRSRESIAEVLRGPLAVQDVKRQSAKHRLAAVNAATAEANQRQVVKCWESESRPSAPGGRRSCLVVTDLPPPRPEALDDRFKRLKDAHLAGPFRPDHCRIAADRLRRPIGARRSRMVVAAQDFRGGGGSASDNPENWTTEEVANYLRLASHSMLCSGVFSLDQGGNTSEQLSSTKLRARRAELIRGLSLPEHTAESIAGLLQTFGVVNRGAAERIFGGMLQVKADSRPGWMATVPNMKVRFETFMLWLRGTETKELSVPGTQLKPAVARCEDILLRQVWSGLIDGPTLGNPFSPDHAKVPTEAEMEKILTVLLCPQLEVSLRREMGTQRGLVRLVARGLLAEFVVTTRQDRDGPLIYCLDFRKFEAFARENPNEFRCCRRLVFPLQSEPWYRRDREAADNPQRQGLAAQNAGKREAQVLLTQQASLRHLAEHFENLRRTRLRKSRGFAKAVRGVRLCNTLMRKSPPTPVVPRKSVAARGGTSRSSRASVSPQRLSPTRATLLPQEVAAA
mmetsp:Transcript_38201/g.85612  ORF Transcript_38201/g.85612 Transcript_38201/m.85612 type:complete len:584 (+) Transcript_38201:304-2055(+)